MSATEAPPSYNDALRVINHLKAHPPSAAVISNSQKAMAKEAASPATARILKKEVKQLAGAVMAIDSSFEKVRLILIGVDKNDYKNKDGTPVKRFVQGWEALQKRYATILRKSQDTAADTHSYIKDFVGFLVPMIKKSEEEVSFKEKLGMLDEFIKKKPKKFDNVIDIRNQASATSEEFNTLRNDVKEYGKNFNNFAEDQRATFTDEIKELQGKLITLDKEIKEQEDAIFKAGVTMGATVFGLGINAIGALVALGPAGPIAAAGIILAGIVALGSEAAVLATYVKAKNDARTQRVQTNLDLKKATANLKELLRLRAMLESANMEIETIVSRIDQFGIVWGLVSQDADIIANDLKAAKEVRTDQEFKDKLELMVASYSALGDALEYYGKITEMPEADFGEEE